ncbi:MAG: hypothetical protein IH627_08970 [Rubrivivax sp.]|nr:hypothetical protein [Rubrivivax sp.]
MALPKSVLAPVLMLAALLSAAKVDAQQTKSPEVKVLVASQDAQGVTQASFDLDSLRNMEAHILERTRVKSNEYLASIGEGKRKVKLTSQATYVQSGAKKLMVIRIADEAGLVTVTVAGIVGQELKRVYCAKETPGAPPISYGPCGEKIREVFGVKL